MTSSWWQYVTRVAGQAEQKEIAARSGIGHTVISRWSNGQVPSVDKVIQFARAYQRPPVEAIVAAGYIEASEVGDEVTVLHSLADVTDDELIGELASRLQAAPPVRPRRSARERLSARQQRDLERFGNAAEQPVDGPLPHNKPIGYSETIRAAKIDRRQSDYDKAARTRDSRIAPGDPGAYADPGLPPDRIPGDDEDPA